MKTTDLSILRKLFDAVASTAFAVVLFVLIIVASLAGTFTTYDVYHAGWFVGLLAAFGINLAACTSKSLIARRARAGSLVTHAGLLVILAGVIVGAFSGVQGRLALSEGETRGEFEVDGAWKKLPFKVRLDEFEIGWNEADQHRLTVMVADAKVSRTLSVRPGMTYEIPGTGYAVEVARFVPDLYVDRDMKVASRSDEPRNPAMEIIVRHAGNTENRWIFAAHPDFSMALDRNIQVAYSFDRKAVDFKATVTVIEEGFKPFSREIMVNHPLKHRGYALYQAHFDPRQPGWTGLDVVRDPGVNVVFAGIALLNIGVFLVLYRRFRKSKPA